MTPPRKPMGYQEAIKLAFKNYCVFTGRAGLAEFWWFQLFTFLVGLVLVMAQKATGMDVFNILSSLFGLATLLPQLGLIWRRLHDRPCLRMVLPRFYSHCRHHRPHLVVATAE